MDTEDTKQETSLQQIDSESPLTDVDSTITKAIGDKYQQMLTICDKLSKGSKPLPNQAMELLNQATDLYDEAKELTPNYKPSKNDTTEG